MADATEAVAEAWASIDGKIANFRADKAAATRRDDEPGWYYSGYLSDAASLIRRLEKRGYTVTPLDRKEDE